MDCSSYKARRVQSTKYHARSVKYAGCNVRTMYAVLSTTYNVISTMYDGYNIRRIMYEVQLYIVRWVYVIRRGDYTIQGWGGISREKSNHPSLPYAQWSTSIVVFIPTAPFASRGYPLLQSRPKATCRRSRYI